MSRTRTRRAELFDGLVALLLAEGFSALTLDELAARLRCSKRTLYALAGSKEQLVRAAVAPEISNIAICVRSYPLALSSAPTATSFRPSGEMSKCSTRVRLSPGAVSLALNRLSTDPLVA